MGAETELGPLVEETVLGIDIGGTRVKVGRVGRNGEVLENREIPTGSKRGRNALLEDLRVLGDSFLENPNVRAVGVGFAGLIDFGEGAILSSPNLPGWDGIQLQKELRDTWGCPVYLDNDANCAALGEAWRGAGEGYDSVVTVTLGTGIGVGIVLEGRIWRGVTGTAGEFGHISLDPLGPECSCGQKGCWEVFASATGLMAEAGRRCPDSSFTSAYEIYEAAGGGDQVACRLLEDLGRWVARGVRVICFSLDPSCVVIGGGVSGAWDFFSPFLMQELSSSPLGLGSRGVSVVRTELQNDAAVVGAAHGAWKILESLEC